MPSFYYKAVTREGETVEDQRDASDEQALVQLLQSEGLIPIRVKPATTGMFSGLLGRRRGGRLSSGEIGIFTRELSALLGAGLPLDRSLAVLAQLSDEAGQLQLLVNQVLDKVRGGGNLSDALESLNGVFSRFYLNMIRAGEAGGDLENVLDRLTDYLERSKELRDTVTTALIYPAILIVMAVGSLFLLLTFVVPQFTEMFESAGQELPLPTQIVVGIADFLQAYWWALLLGVGGFVSYMRLQLADAKKRVVWDRRFLSMPLVGDLVSKMEVASFSRTLGTLLNNGVSLLTALSIVKETLSNRVLASVVAESAESLKEGRDMCSPLINSGYFPPMALQMIKLGEETGRLEEMLERVAITYDKEIRVSVQRMLALLEPLLIVGLGIMIAGIIISILMAILSVNDLAF